MSDTVTIAGFPRSQTGKSYTRKIRANGRVPGVLLNKGKTTLLEIEGKMLPKAYAANKQFDLTLDGKTQKVKIQELHVDQVSRAALHVDLMLV